MIRTLVYQGYAVGDSLKVFGRNGVLLVLEEEVAKTAGLLQTYPTCCHDTPTHFGQFGFEKLSSRLVLAAVPRRSLDDS